MRPPTLQQQIFFIILTAFALVWFCCPQDCDIQKLESKEIQNTSLNTLAPKETVILIWTWPYRQRFELDRCQADFGISHCKLTIDRSLYSSADAVIVHHADIMYFWGSLPKEPRPNFQHWVWFNLEPPIVITNLEKVDNAFNLTMTFRRDSDIFCPYGRLEALREPKPFTMPFTKTKLVTWIVSRWYSTLPRNVYYKELRKHIKIDIYGAGHKPLSSYDLDSTVSQYKFYLAFENSIYKDYITEKLWSRAFGSWAVPVVFGTSRKNYEDYIPGDAFIHVDDFSSPKELADYLLQLDKDDEKYLKYFSWRSRYEVKVSPWTYHYCAACAMLKWGPKYQIAKNISKWFLNGL